MIQRADNNGDGDVDFAEFCELMCVVLYDSSRALLRSTGLSFRSLIRLQIESLQMASQWTRSHSAVASVFDRSQVSYPQRWAQSADEEAESQAAEQK